MFTVELSYFCRRREDKSSVGVRILGSCSTFPLLARAWPRVLLDHAMWIQSYPALQLLHFSVCAASS